MGINDNPDLVELINTLPYKHCTIPQAIFTNNELYDYNHSFALLFQKDALEKQYIVLDDLIEHTHQQVFQTGGSLQCQLVGSNENVAGYIEILDTQNNPPTFLISIITQYSLNHFREQMNRFDSFCYLTSSTTHDFNNILTAIMGNVSLAKAFASDDEKIFAKLSEAENATNKAKDLSRHLHLAALSHKPTREPVNPATIIQEGVRFALMGKPFNCQFMINEPLPDIAINSEQFLFALQTLTSFLCEFENGNNQILVEVDPLANGRQCKVTISRIGIDIEHEELSNLFNPSLSTRSRGFQNNIALAKYILNNLSCQLKNDFLNGTGLSFEITLEKDS